MAAKSKDKKSGVPEWVVTYGDMMSLLLTFFIMLVSLSELKDEEGKIRLMMDAIREAFGATAGRAGVPGESLQPSSVLDKLRSQGTTSEGGMKQSGRESEGRAGAHKTVQRINHGTVVTMGGPTLFGRFDASLTPAMKKNLEIIVNVVGPKPNRLMIRGHASPEPLPPGFQLELEGFPVRDQFDLSFARARAVADFLKARGIEKERMLVNAAGDTEPRTLTRQKAAQKLNRRVDVFLVDSYIKPSP